MMSLMASPVCDFPYLWLNIYSILWLWEELHIFRDRSLSCLFPSWYLEAFDTVTSNTNTSRLSSWHYIICRGAQDVWMNQDTYKHSFSGCTRSWLLPISLKMHRSYAGHELVWYLYPRALTVKPNRVWSIIRGIAAGFDVLFNDGSWQGNQGESWHDVLAICDILIPDLTSSNFEVSHLQGCALQYQTPVVKCLTTDNHLRCVKSQLWLVVPQTYPSHTDFISS